MNTTVYLALAVAACLCLAEGAPEGRLPRKQQRPTRGFKNLEMMTARGFGKRAEQEEIRITRGTFKPNSNVLIARAYGKRQEATTPEDDDEIRAIRGFFKPNSNILIARGYGKRREGSGVYGVDNFWENLEAAQEKDGQDADEKTLQSIPLDWFANEMVQNPDFARSVVRKFIDLNQDGVLTSDELLRNV